jgi:hypothetical protein
MANIFEQPAETLAPAPESLEISAQETSPETLPEEPPPETRPTAHKNALLGLAISTQDTLNSTPHQVKALIFALAPHIKIYIEGYAMTRGHQESSRFNGACAEIEKSNMRLKTFDFVVDNKVQSFVISGEMLKNMHNVFQRVSLLNSSIHPNRSREYRELRAAARNWVVQKNFPDVLLEILGLKMEEVGKMESTDRSIPNEG